MFQAMNQQNSEANVIKRRETLERLYAIMGPFYLILLAIRTFYMLGYSVITIATGELEAMTHRLPLPFADFLRFWLAGKMILTDDRFRIYDINVQTQWLSRYIAPAHYDKQIFLQSVPFMFAMFTPLAGLNFAAAFLLWISIGMLAAGASLYVLLRQYRHWTGLSSGIFLFAILSSLPTWRTIMVGQMGFYFIACIVGYWLAFKDAKHTVAGICLALTTVKPQYSVFLLIPALMQNRKKLLLSFVVAETVLVLLGIATVGWQNVINYPSILWHLESAAVSDPVLMPENMLCFRGPLTVLLGAQMGAKCASVIALAGLGWIAMIWRRFDCLGQEKFPWLVSLTMLILMIFSPHFHYYDELLLAIAAALTLPGVSLNKVLGEKSSLVKIWSLIIIMLPALSWSLMDDSLGPLRYHLVGLINVILLLLACGIIRRLAPATATHIGQ